MTTTTSPGRVVGIITAIIGILAAWAALELTNGPIDQALQQLSLAQASLSEDQVAIRQIPILLVKQQDLRKRVGHISIGKGTIPDLLQFLQQVAGRHHVLINDMTFSPASSPAINVSAPGGAPRPAISQSEGAQAASAVADPHNPASTGDVMSAPPASMFAEQPVAFTITGRYTDLLYTLADLSRGPVLVRVDAQPTLTRDDANVKMAVKATLLEVGDSFRAAAGVPDPAPPASTQPVQTAHVVPTSALPAKNHRKHLQKANVLPRAEPIGSHHAHRRTSPRA